MSEKQKLDKQKLLIELQNNPKVQEYLAEYDPDSAKSFLESYASEKEMFLRLGEDWRKIQRAESDYFRECAERYYWMIKQKKLYNLQCQWRARQIDLPTISTTWDFTYWGNNIKNCTLVEEATEEEMDAMIQYLEQAGHHDDDEGEEWQEYDQFKDEKTGGTTDYYPDWYHFYDTQFGTSYVTLLPDLVGMDEDRYHTAWRDKEFGDREQPEPKKKGKYCGSEITEDFIRKIEPYKVLEYYRLHNEQIRKMDFLEQLEDVLEILKEEEGNVFMPEGRFPDAIFDALHLLTVSKLKVLLPEMHREHMDRKAMGISYDDTDSFYYDLAQTMIERLGEGKRLLGEE